MPGIGIPAEEMCGMHFYAEKHLQSIRLVHLVAVDLLRFLVRPPLRGGRYSAGEFSRPEYLCEVQPRTSLRAYLPPSFSIPFSSTTPPNALVVSIAAVRTVSSLQSRYLAISGNTF